MADGSLELIAYNQKVFEKQKGLARKVESVKDTQATDLNALSENNDRPVFDDSQRCVMAVLVAFETNPSDSFKIGADSEKEQPSAEPEGFNLIYSQKQKISRSITVRLMFNL